jgi:DNA ligase-4
MPVLLKKVVKLLEAVELRQLDPRPTHSERWRAVKDLIYEWFNENRADIGQNPQTVLAIMSALLPDLRPDRVYMLPEGLLSRALAKALFVAGTRREDDLLKWKEATVWEDLGSAVFKVMRAAEPSAGGTVTIEELDGVLNRLAAWSHFSDNELRARIRQGQPLDRRSRLLQDLFLRLNSSEGKWVTRIILKSLLPVTMPGIFTMNLIVSVRGTNDETENVTLQAYHFLLPKLYLLQDNLERACARICSDEFVAACPDPCPSPELYYRSLRQHIHLLKPEVGIKVGRAEFLKATSCQHAVRLSKGRNMLLERKYDGEYAQIHLDLRKDGKDWIKIFSKSGKNSTEDRVRIHDTLREALSLENQDMRGFRQKCILEGEIVVYDDDEQKILPFHHLRSHISRKGIFIGSKNDESPKARNSHLMILLFDVLLVDDTSLLDVPLSARLQQLDKILVSPSMGRCEKAEQTVIDFSEGQKAADRLMKCFARAIEWRWEGCILKPFDAPYFNLLEDRRDKTSLGYQRVGTDSAWIKLKKDYIEGLGDTEDFAIVGGITDNKRRLALKQLAGTMNTFHVAVLMNKRQVKGLGEKPRLKVVCEVSYSIEKLDLEWIQKHRYFDAVEYDPEVCMCSPQHL